MPADKANPILNHLQALVREYHEISEAAEFYAALLPLLHAADLRADPLPLTPEAARAKLASGVPLLEDVDLPIDEDAACGLMIRVADVLGAMPADKEQRPVRAAFACNVTWLLDQGKVRAGAVLRQVSLGNEKGIRALALAWHVDAGLLWLLARHTLTPFLTQWARQWAPLVDTSHWLQSRCFVCGAEALLGELQGEAAAKHLRCGQCGADWAGRRLECAYCGNDHPGTFNHLYLKAHPNGRRVEVCDACHGYLKVILTFDPTPPERLLIQDLATIHLDYIAQERGYVKRS